MKEDDPVLLQKEETDRRELQIVLYNGQDE